MGEVYGKNLRESEGREKVSVWVSYDCVPMCQVCALQLVTKQGGP